MAMAMALSPATTTITPDRTAAEQATVAMSTVRVEKTAPTAEPLPTTEEAVRVMSAVRVTLAPVLVSEVAVAVAAVAVAVAAEEDKR